jgi:preprotein translocase subunit YajC
MHLNVSEILAMGPPQGTQQDPKGQMLNMLVWFGMFGIIFYFLLLRPQQKKAKEQAELLKGVKSGDKIVTSSGIIATVITVKEDSISIRSSDAKLEITKGAIAEIRERAGETSAS